MNRLSAAAFVFGVVLAPLWSGSASAERRVALIIGNSAYQNAPALANPNRDARAIAAKFKQAGFDVVSAQFDLGNLPFKRAIRQFEDAAADADIAVVFYAGHGIEIGGDNYMIPVDARLASDRDAEDEAIKLTRLVESVDGAKRLGLVILDACRDNPFAAKMKRQRVTAVRAVSPGLALVEPVSRNTLIAYAAKAGAAAEDGETQHSPYTNALLNNLFEPGLELRFAFGRVRDEVLKNTGSRQEPYVAGSLGGETIYLVPAPEQPRVAALDLDGQRRDYELVEKIGKKAAWELFLRQHPTGFYSELGRQQLDKLMQDEPALQPAKPALERVAAVEPSRPSPMSVPSSEEQRAWERIRDSGDAAALRDFIRRYPSSVLTRPAQTRLDALERAAQEREDKARAEREAKAAEAARQEAEREALRKRAEDEHRAKAAEAARQRAEQEALRKRAEEEQRAKAAEVARLKAEQEAARKRADEERRAAEATRLKAEREAALKRAEQERLAKQAEAERQKAEREAAAKRAEEERLAKQAEAARQKAEREAALKRAEEEQLAKLVEAARQKAEREVAAKRADEEQRTKTTETERQKAEREAAAKRADEERLAKQAEAARQKAEREATAKRAEEERLAAEAERQKAEREAAAKRAEEERLAKLAETARQNAQREAALKRAEEERVAKLAETARQNAQREAALKRAEEEQRAKAAEAAERQKLEREAALKRAEEERLAKQVEAERAKQEATCRQEESRITSLQAAKNRGKALEDLKRLEQALGCERLRPSVTAALEKMTEKPEPAVQQKDKDEETPGRRQRAKQEESRKSARHKDDDEKPSRQRAKREESRPQARVRQEARTAPVRHSGGGGGGGMIGVGF